jgi:hypothetical protein
MHLPEHTEILGLIGKSDELEARREEVHLFAPMGKTPPILNFFRMMAGTTRLELATSAVTECFDVIA